MKLQQAVLNGLNKTGGYRDAVRAFRAGADPTYKKVDNGGFGTPQVFKALVGGTPGAAKTRSLRLAKWRKLNYRYNKPSIGERIGDRIGRMIAPPSSFYTG